MSEFPSSPEWEDQVILEQAVRSSYQMNEVKGRFRAVAIFDLLLFYVIILLIFRTFGLITDLPVSILEYGFLLHIPHAVWGFLLLAASGSTRTTLFSITVVIGCFVLLLDLWALVTTALWLVFCIIGGGTTAITTCGVDALYRIALLVISAFLFFFTVTCVTRALDALKFLRLVNPRESNSVPFKKRL